MQLSYDLLPIVCWIIGSHIRIIRGAMFAVIRRAAHVICTTVPTLAHLTRDTVSFAERALAAWPL